MEDETAQKSEEAQEREGSEKENIFKNNSVIKNRDIMHNPELLVHLRNLGLNQYEAQAYLTLSLGGVSTAGEVAEGGSIARPRVYDVLEKLQEKGFVAIKSGRPVKYAAVGIGEAVETLKKHHQNRVLDEVAKMDDISKQLQKKLETSTATRKYGIEDNVWTLRGRNAIYSRMAEMLGRSKEHIVVSSHPEGIVSKIRANLKHFENAKARGVKIHIVSPFSKITDKRSAIHSQASQINKLATSMIDKPVPTRMMLSDNEALIFLTGEKSPAEEEVGLWINSPHLVSTLKQALLGKQTT